MFKYTVFIDFNSIAFTLIGAAGQVSADPRGVTEGQAPCEYGARRGTEGRVNSGRSWKLANNSSRCSTCISQ